MRIILMILAFLLSSCSGFRSDMDSAYRDSNENILIGTWGWNSDQCENNPMTISFSEDGRYMYHDSPKGMYTTDKEKSTERAIYVVHTQSEKYLVTSLESEDRKDDRGNLVSWDLVIQTSDSFCWHRADWKEGSCTKSMVRCK